MAPCLPAIFIAHKSTLGIYNARCGQFYNAGPGARV